MTIYLTDLRLHQPYAVILKAQDAALELVGPINRETKVVKSLWGLWTRTITHVSYTKQNSIDEVITRINVALSENSDDPLEQALLLRAGLVQAVITGQIEIIDFLLSKTDIFLVEDLNLALFPRVVCFIYGLHHKDKLLPESHQVLHQTIAEWGGRHLEDGFYSRNILQMSQDSLINYAAQQGQLGMFEYLLNRQQSVLDNKQSLVNLVHSCLWGLIHFDAKENRPVHSMNECVAFNYVEPTIAELPYRLARGGYVYNNLQGYIIQHVLQLSPVREIDFEKTLDEYMVDASNKNLLQNSKTAPMLSFFRNIASNRQKRSNLVNAGLEPNLPPNIIELVQSYDSVDYEQPQSLMEKIKRRIL